jgi:ligand-binding sensor domain-containing protein/signal transduction histidine kinase
MKKVYLWIVRFQFAILILTLHHNLYCQQKNLQFKQITPDEGLSSSTIRSIYQDHKGFIWIGTYDGLNRYDGFEFVVYKNQSTDSTSLPRNLIWTVFEDRQKNLLIGTSGGLSLYDWNTDAFINYMNSKFSPLNNIICNVRHIVEDSLGNLWLATDLGLIYFDRQNNDYVQYTHDPRNPKSLSTNNIEYIFMDSRNNLWIGTNNGLNLFQPETQTFKHFMNNTDHDNGVSNIPFLRIIEDREGTLWFGTYGKGIYCLKPEDIESGKLINYRHDPEDKWSLAADRVFCLYNDEDNYLWIGTENHGLDIFDRKKGVFYHYRSDIYNPSSLNNESIQEIYKDNAGNLWIGTFAGGINLLKKHSDAIIAFRNIPGVSMSLSHNSVTSFMEDHPGRIWIGTDGGGLNFFNIKTGRFSRFNSTNSNLNSDAVLSIVQDSNNKIWLGTWAGGINSFDEETGSFQSFTKKNSSIPDDNIFYVMEDKKGSLWLGSFQNGLIHYNRERNRFTKYTTENSDITNNMIVVIKERPDGNLLVGTNTGFNIFHPEEKRFYPYLHDPQNTNSVSNDGIHDILVENDSTIWIATQNGLNLFNPESGSFTHYNEKNGLPDNVIKGLILDQSGILWISTNKGVCKFNPVNGTVKNFTKADGLQSNEFNYHCSLKTRDGSILLGGTKGFNVIYPDKIVENTNIPPVLITDFRIFNKPVKIGARHGSPLKKHISDTEEITLSYKQSVFTFNFAVMDFTMPEKNRYAFMMEGFEQDWNYVESQRIATYTSLPPGEYTFKVKGSNNDGLWNEQGKAIRIIITPPFWQTWWFRTFMIMCIVAVIFITHKIRVRGIEAHRRELEIKVKERTRQLSEKATALELAKKETDNILSNVEEGFLLLDHHYNISSQYSSALESIFCTKNLAHVNLIDFMKDKLSERNIKNTTMYLELLFDDTVNENAIKDLNPLIDLEFIFPKGVRPENRNSAKLSKYLNFSFKRIISKDNKINELIVTVRDVTRAVLLAKQLKEEEERRERLLQLMLGILDVEPDMLNEFCESTHRELTFIDKILNQDEIADYENLLVKIHRAVHLVKGNAKLLNIDYIAQAAHKFEDIITAIQQKNQRTGDDLEQLRKYLNDLQNGLEEMELIIDRMAQLHTQRDAYKKPDARLLLKSLENLINSFSSDLGKKIKFNYKKFKSQIIPSRYHLLVKEVLIQLIRNSISHGIEFPEERKRLKKPQYGKIEISTFKKNGSIGFRLRDDGRGIQIEKLRETALKTGKWKAEDINSWTNQQIAELIFKSGITTAKNVNMLAGRGVGMDGVVHRLQEYQGKINVHFAEGKYCEFEILLPAVS